MKTFLTAEWTNLLVATYEVDKNILQKFLPCKTELNDWNGKYLLSIVGFMFRNPAVMGFRMPLFKCFPEINLRFYVKAKYKSQWRTGVVFIREISPSIWIGLTAKLLYHESFISIPIKNVNLSNDKERYDRYAWKKQNKWNCMELTSGIKSVEVKENSIESFISDQYIAFTKLNAGRSLVFEVTHSPWKIYPAIHFKNDLNAEVFKVKGLHETLDRKPLVSFLMDGSFTEISSPRSLM
ncbi:MAG: DUF2071 domain-containing protein [Chitinophagaceae bacterium]|nr:DUF2071 domain-containing protein [Chitinophagaceae bacterium]